MGALTRLAQQVNSSASNYFAPMPNKRLKHLFEVKNLWLTVYQCHHIDTENRLQLRLRVEVIEHHFAQLTALKLNHHPQAILI